MSRVTVESHDQPYTQTLASNGHEWLADEPKDHGGQDKGPGPYELLLSSLGACTSMTVQMYAERKEWPLEGVKVELENREIHAEDCRDCAQREGKITEIDVSLTLHGDLSEEQRQRLREIARRCPVRRTLTSEIKVREPG